VNLGKRRVAMSTARRVLEELGFDQVGSYVNSGNLLFSSGGTAADHEATIRPALEDVFGFELTTFVRTARQVKANGTPTRSAGQLASHPGAKRERAGSQLVQACHSAAYSPSNSTSS
jgi:uncharacterized protein (DUF1697 family)